MVNCETPTPARNAAATRTATTHPRGVPQSILISTGQRISVGRRRCGGAMPTSSNVAPRASTNSDEPGLGLSVLSGCRVSGGVKKVATGDVIVQQGRSRALILKLPHRAGQRVTRWSGGRRLARVPALLGRVHDLGVRHLRHHRGPAGAGGGRPGRLGHGRRSRQRGALGALPARRPAGLAGLGLTDLVTARPHHVAGSLAGEPDVVRLAATSVRTSVSWSSGVEVMPATVWSASCCQAALSLGSRA